jgi:DNA-binding SARP family transcriptional activator
MEFRLLGPPAVIEQDRVLALGHGRQRSLVAAPLLHANEVVATASAP